MTWTAPKASSSARGYGYAHRQERGRRVAEHTPASPCSNCGRPLGPDTSKWHLPHTADRTAYLPGLHCARCNIRDGSIRGAKLSNANRQQRQRPWVAPFTW